VDPEAPTEAPLPPTPQTQGVPAPEAPPAPAGNRSSLRRRILLIAIVLELLLILGVAGAYALRLRHAPATPHAGPSATAGASATAPSVSPSMTPGAALPAGLHYVHDPTGFTVAVPDGWTRSVRNGIVYFQDPNGGRLLGVDQSNQPKPDPVADWQNQANVRVAHGDFPGYQLIGIKEVAYHVKAADWEFTYNGRNGRLHVINRGSIFNDHQAYGLYWETPDAQWQANLETFAWITGTFQGKQ
jgi:eukaryotic-like serine/threonine-protein kinase